MRSGRASATVKKERAALNSFLRWLVEFEHISALQARQALAVKLPRAEQGRAASARRISARQHYDDLIRAAKAAIADDPLAGARDLAIVLVLGDAGLRCEELAGLERRDVQAARKGAKLRTLADPPWQGRSGTAGQAQRARDARDRALGARTGARLRCASGRTPRCSSRLGAGAQMARYTASADAAASRCSPR